MQYQPSTDVNKLATLLRERRVECGFSLRQLAAQSGVPRSTLLRLEQAGTQGVSPQLLQRLARALELPTAQLFVLAGIDLPVERLSLPAMLRAEYDLSPEAVIEAQRAIEDIARHDRGNAGHNNDKEGENYEGRIKRTE